MEGVSKYCMIYMCIVVFVVTTVPNLTTAHGVPEFVLDPGLGSQKCPSSGNIALTDQQKKQILQAEQSGVIKKLSSINTATLYKHTEPIVTDFTDDQKNAITCKYGEMIQAINNKDEKRPRRNPEVTARICPAYDFQSLLVFALNADNNVVQIVQIYQDCQQIVIQQPCIGNASPHIQTTTHGSLISCMTEDREVPVVAVQITNGGVTGIGIEFITVESCTAIFSV